MKIVFPVLSLEMGGGARFIYQLANALLDRGHDIEVVMPKAGSQVWPLRTKITRVKELTPSSIPSGDFILPNFYPTVKPAWESKKGRVVRLSLGYEPQWVPDSVTAKQSYLIDAPILSISEWHRQLILKETGLESTVISGGVDTSIFHPYPKPSEQTGRKTIFYIMRDPNSGYTWKGGEDFLKAVTLLNKQIDFNLIVSLPEDALFTSPVPCEIKTSTTDQALARIYAEADLYVFTSYFEAFGLPPLEAMACGTAVVTTDCGGNRDYVSGDENCLLIAPSDIEQLTAAMYRVLTQNDERQRLASSGHSFAQAWSWQRTAKQVEAFLMSI
jgi:glycosyltransferase involved in cell wall biosynthesis